MATNPPNKGGSGPHTTKQGKSGPILSSHNLSQGSNGSTKGKVARKVLGSVPVELIQRARRPVIVISPPS